MVANFDPEKIAYFKTAKGFEEYKKAFAAFYHTSNIYGGKEDGQPSIMDIAGGLSFGVLVNQGVVSAVDGVERDSPNFRDAVKRGLYVALISFDQTLLRSLRPDIDQVINEYPILETATALAMREIPLIPHQV